MEKYHSTGADECINSIAFENGFFWETIWNHAQNSKLKNERKNPNILKEGDVVYIPELSVREVSKSTDQLHKFKRKGTPAMLRLQILEEPPPKDDQQPTAASSPLPQNNRNIESGDPEIPPEERKDKPRANEPFVLKIDGSLIEGKTDGEGRIQMAIPPNARSGELILSPGTDKETIFPLQLGYLQPITEISGVKARLRNLGFDCGDVSDEETPNLAAALRAFQEKNGLEPTGEIDENTRNRLKQIHGS